MADKAQGAALATNPNNLLAAIHGASDPYYNIHVMAARAGPFWGGLTVVDDAIRALHIFQGNSFVGDIVASPQQCQIEVLECTPLLQSHLWVIGNIRCWRKGAVCFLIFVVPSNQLGVLQTCRPPCGPGWMPRPISLGHTWPGPLRDFLSDWGNLEVRCLCLLRKLSLSSSPSKSACSSSES